VLGPSQIFERGLFYALFDQKVLSAKISFENKLHIDGVAISERRIGNGEVSEKETKL